MKKDTENTLRSIKTKLMTDNERSSVWSRIETNYVQAQQSTSLLAVIKRKTTMLKKLLVILLIFSMTGATAYASNSAKPGDFLFTLDRGLEELQLAIASGENEDKLRIEFAKERLEEINEILGITSDLEDSDSATTTSTTTDSTGTSTTTATTTDSTSATTTATSTDESSSHSSTTSEIALSDKDRERVAQAITLALELLDLVATDNDDINTALDELIGEINKNIDEVGKVRSQVSGNDNKVQIKVKNDDGKIFYKEDDDGRIKFETRSDDGKTRIEIKKDGRVKVKTKNEDDDDEWEKDDDDEYVDSDDDDKDDDDDKRGRDKKDRDDDDDDEDDDKKSSRWFDKIWGGEKVVLCHKGKETITVSGSSKKAHLNHGDTEGRCGSRDDDDDNDEDDNDNNDNSEDTTAPVISNTLTVNITDTTATVEWTTDEGADSKVEYSTSTGLSGGVMVEGESSTTTTHSLGLSGLLPETEYYYRVISKDESGNIATSSIGSFETLGTPDTVAPVISDVTSTSTGTTSRAITWSTDEPATSKVLYASSTPVTSTSALVVESGALETSHSLEISSLSASTTYYFVVVSADGDGNTATSTEMSFAI